MKKLFMILSLAFLLCFTFGCQQAEEVAEETVVDVEAEKEEIKDILDEWVVAYNAGEFERLVSFYFADDAVQMNSNQPILEGKEAILANFKEAREAADEYCESSIYENVRVSGDLAFVLGNDIFTATPKAGGEPIKTDSKWVAIFERQSDGTWKCIVEAGNSNLPLPTLLEQE